MGNPLPTLSASGWVTDVAEKADLLTANYFVSEESQSVLYSDMITSLPGHVQRFGHNDQILRQEMRARLETYYGRYFDTVTVDVSTDKPNPSDPNRINVTLSIMLTDDGVQYSLGRQIEVVNSKVAKIIELNNN